MLCIKWDCKLYIGKSLCSWLLTRRAQRSALGLQLILSFLFWVMRAGSLCICVAPFSAGECNRDWWKIGCVHRQLSSDELHREEKSISRRTKCTRVSECHYLSCTIRSLACRLARVLASVCVCERVCRKLFYALLRWIDGQHCQIKSCSHPHRSHDECAEDEMRCAARNIFQIFMVIIYLMSSRTNGGAMLAFKLHGEVCSLPVCWGLLFIFNFSSWSASGHVSVHLTSRGVCNLPFRRQRLFPIHVFEQNLCCFAQFFALILKKKERIWPNARYNLLFVQLDFIDGLPVMSIALPSLPCVSISIRDNSIRFEDPFGGHSAYIFLFHFVLVSDKHKLFIFHILLFSILIVHDYDYDDATSIKRTNIPSKHSSIHIHTEWRVLGDFDFLARLSVHRALRTEHFSCFLAVGYQKRYLWKRLYYLESI